MFLLFADLIALHLDADRRRQAQEAVLEDALETGGLREQFIAMLGHDFAIPWRRCRPRRRS